jgi:hypothetical protein
LVFAPVGTNRSWTAVYADPGAVVQAPLGRYLPSVQVSKGSREAVLDSNEEVTVARGGVSVLRAGGPLTNSVSDTRRGAVLRLSYQLLGEGGEYRLVRTKERTPPTFKIFREGKQLASGQFEFG